MKKNNNYAFSEILIVIVGNSTVFSLNKKA
jgi:hypothetical protein